MVGRRYRIRVVAKPRKNPDLRLLAQVVMVYGRHLWRKRQDRNAGTPNGGDM